MHIFGPRGTLLWSSGTPCGPSWAPIGAQPLGFLLFTMLSSASLTETWAIIGVEQLLGRLDCHGDDRDSRSLAKIPCVPSTYQLQTPPYPYIYIYILLIYIAYIYIYIYINS